MANSVDGTININQKAPITGQYHESKLGKKNKMLVLQSLKLNYKKTTSI